MLTQPRQCTRRLTRQCGDNIGVDKAQGLQEWRPGIGLFGGVGQHQGVKVATRVGSKVLFKIIRDLVHRLHPDVGARVSRVAPVVAFGCALHHTHSGALLLGSNRCCESGDSRSDDDHIEDGIIGFHHFSISANCGCQSHQMPPFTSSTSPVTKPAASPAR